jgi:AcrR family transcriptional regulator
LQDQTFDRTLEQRVEERSRYDEKFDRILRSAAAVFADKGFHRASIRDVCRASGVSLAGLYYYVASKDELLFRIQDHCFGTLVDDAERVLSGEADPVHRFHLFVENHLRYFVGNMKEMKVLSHEAESLEGEYRRIVNQKKRRYADLCASILSELRPEGSPIELRVATFSLFGMLNWIYNWYRPERDVPVGELAEEMSRLFLDGFLGAGSPARSMGPPGAPEAPGPSIWRH